MEEEIKAEFKKNDFNLDEEEDILKKCLTFCIQYKLSPSDLVSSWDLYSINRQLELTVQNAHMDAFLLHVQNEQKEAIIRKESGLHLYSNDVAIICFECVRAHCAELVRPDGFNTKDGILGTPTERSDILCPESFDSTDNTNGDVFSFGKPSESVTPFGQRKSKFVVQSTLGDLAVLENIKKEHDHANSEDYVIQRVQPSTRCSLFIHGSQPEPGCRFMYDKMDNKVLDGSHSSALLGMQSTNLVFLMIQFNFLENRIRKHATALVASGLCEEVMDPTVASQKSVFAVGMICCDEGRLKEKPVLLQSSVEHSGGQRVRLDLQKLSQFSIFPGQVVGVEGHNPSGHCLIASKIVDYIPLSVSFDEHLHPTKKQAVNLDFQSTDPSHVLAELSMVCKLKLDIPK
ncbi:hypothetical protein U1Q18_017212 [Sarracenia purpurea var. burkii]